MHSDEHHLDNAGRAAAAAPVIPETVEALPTDALVLISTRNLVLFPGSVLPISLGRQRSIAAAQAAMRLNRPVGLILQREPADDDPLPASLHNVGTEAHLLRYVTSPDGGHHVICQGERRFRVIEFLDGYPFLVARVEHLAEPTETTKGVDARLMNLRNQALEILELLPQTPGELVNAVHNVASAPSLADLIASFMDITPAEKQEILETVSIERRLERVSELLAYRLEVLRLSRQISDRTKETIDERQREILLREQMKQIQKELGEDAGPTEEMREIGATIEKAGMPAEALEQAQQALKRLERMPDTGPEYSMPRAWLDWMIQLPWSKLDEEAIDIANARRVLDEDHYGLVKIKKRILEFLAVRKLNPAGPQPDPVLRRSAGRRQDFAWPEHRARPRAEIRAHQPGWRAR